MILDRWQRPLGHLRISVTDRCNLRCAYCMPEPDYVWLPRTTLLTFEELTRVTRLFAGLGVRHVRLTGGEPLLRAQVADLTAQLAAIGTLDDLAMTTNGVLLAAQATRLREAGLRRITVSLDTLQRARFEALTRRDHLADVLAGIDAAVTVFGAVKLDTVLMRGVNDDEIEALVAFAGSRHAEIRFIEYMDVPGATHWEAAKVVSRSDILRRVQEAFGDIETLAPDGPAPASRYRLASGQVFGIIASTTTPFCSTCDRIRLTADGHLFSCLYATQGLDIRTPLRTGASDEDLVALLTTTWQQRADRGAEARLSAPDRGAFIAVEDLRRAPQLEMHTRGG
ncbi:Cyclic pyranopterin monophosphate synthase 1 [Luteitalea pratensis]|uniref:GTP 3',8-cyclase n=1 Tax=Luteitalea pratensis TaxID=1855912 RepID=A0A143PMW3_LUTPR|nr:GTP 3',8-cyclase MoaA [Luteitalea pratensis]AMY09945.1 Cyclic pyranopterin monophosphate synthase 1 [Luteitalea pratensis]